MRFIFTSINLQLFSVDAALSHLIKIAIVLTAFLPWPVLGNFQPDTIYPLSFSFDNEQIREDNNKITIKPVGVTLVEDRFSNKQSAIYFQGSSTSYLNLGTNKLLKPEQGAISLWVKYEGLMHAGKGYSINPLYMVRNSAEEDFNFGICIAVNYENKRIAAQCTKNATLDVIARAKDTLILNSWYHIVVVFTDEYLKFYVNGELQTLQNKGFTTTYHNGDSVLIGRSHSSIKNERFTNAVIDDIKIFNYPLSNIDVLNLYNAPNPNRLKLLLFVILKYGVLIVAFFLMLALIIWRGKIRLKRQKEYYELNNKIKELEIKVVKSQMNPHFISNCLAAIQNLIYNGDVDTAGQYLAKFSFFMRQVLDFSEQTYILLSEEINVIKLNVELEQLRFKNNFEFDLKIDQSLNANEIYIPSLITQPFIENAIWHGLLPLKNRNPKLEVSVYQKNGTLFIEIEDNGVGRKKQEENVNKRSRGTKLILDKLDNMNRLTNSFDFSMEIKDVLDHNLQVCGTNVTVQISNYLKD